MKIGLAQDTAKTAKNLAQQIAKQMAREPIEILNEAKDQAFGIETSGQPENNTRQGSDSDSKKNEAQHLMNDKIKSSRQMEALNRELSDIRKQDLFKDLQRRISEGEDVPIADYSELSVEQKQVLNAQEEAVKEQKAAAISQQDQFIEPAVKKGRQLFNFGKKTAVKREQTHVEKPVPPSG